MGQGAWSGLAQLVCEELDAKWSDIRVAMAPVSRDFFAPWGYGTGGSRSIRGMFTMMRKIGAGARAVLISAAASEWRVPEHECSTESGLVRHVASGRERSFGELAPHAAKLSPPNDPPLKPRSQWRIIGASPQRVDSASKCDGSATFGMDIRLPGMRFAAVRHCPVIGGKLIRLDHSPARALRGVLQVVDLDDAFAVIATDTWSAMRGLDALQPEWDSGANAEESSNKLADRFLSAIDAGGKLVADDSSRPTAERALTAMQSATQRLSATYFAPLIAHAQIEPMNATAWIQGEHVEIWAPTQQQADLRENIAQTLGLPLNRIVVHTPLLGGGFGRRLRNDYAIEAALIARHVNAPVQVVWPRAADFARGYFRPAAASRFEAGMDNQGNLQALSVCIASLDATPRIGGLPEQPYAIDAKAFFYAPTPTAIRFGSWRSVDMSQNTFFLESFLDECATHSGRDPLELRLAMLNDEPRAQAVLNAVATLARWQSRKQDNRFLGLAYAHGFHSHTAQIVEVSTSASGVRAERIYIALDCGTVVNPMSVKSQLQGGALMAFSAALLEQITISNGNVDQNNFDTYPVLRFAEAPKIEITLLDTPDAPIGGVGEVGVPPLAPALANAVYAATGVRLRSMPLRSDARVVWRRN